MPNRPVASTKLTIPRSLRAVVPRSDLRARLDDPSWRLALVSAPAGFGKTTLLSEWALDRVDPPAWFSCDQSDAEPVRFWSGLIASLGRRWPGVGDDAMVALRRSGTEEQHVVISLANDLADVVVEAGTTPLLVIDDLHLSNPAPSILAAFIEAVPRGVQLLIGSRHQPPFSLARRRIAGDLLELRAEDLRFSELETAALLAQHGIELTSAEMVRMQALIEGWPAALQLAAMTLRRTPDRVRFLDALASTDGPLSDYLVNEVLIGLPEDWVEFLLATSVLEEFDVSLCEQMTGRADAWNILHGLIGAELFVTSLDEVGEWYRYHHLFGAFMRARLRALGGDRLRSTHKKAAEVLEDRGLIEGAMRQALAFGGIELPASIARRAFGRAMHAADIELSGAAARGWLYERGRETVAAEPMAVLEFVGILAASGGSEDVANWLELVAAAHPDPTSDVATMLHGTWADHYLARGQADEAVRHIDVALDAFNGAPPSRGLLPLVYPIFIRAHLTAGDIDTARATLDRVGAHPVGNVVLDEVRLRGLRAWVACVDGDLTLAARLADSAAGAPTT